MKYLLDTHILLWSMDDNPNLPDKVKAILEDKNNEIYYSTASIWEVQIKHQAHPNDMVIDGQKLSEDCRTMYFRMLPITDSHVFQLGSLHRSTDAPAHKDPFDRIMLAQAKSEGLIFITHDSLIPYYYEKCVLQI